MSVPATPDVKYRIRFITTKKGTPLDPVSYVEIPAMKEHMNRARVESDAPTQFKRKRCLHPKHHTAWTQPYA